MRLPIAAKLLGVFLVPAAATFVGFSLLAHREASRLLEDELGRRLAGVAASAAHGLEDDELALLQPGDEETRTYRNVRRRLEELRGAAGVQRLYVFDDHDASLCDTQPTPIGERYFALSRSAAEVRAARGGVATSSVLFVGSDGQRYKSAFAAVPGQARWIVGVDGAAPMYEQLAALRRALVTTASAGVAVVVLLSFVAARILVGPLLQLARAAARIGRGDLEAQVERRSSDEIGAVADTLEHMRVQLRARDERTQMMLAGIAHEVRNPLGGLQLYAGLLRDELPADQGELHGHVRKIERELDHLKVIVSDFLEYARRPRPVLQPVSAAELLEEVRQLVAPDAAARGVAVEVAAEPIILQADVGQLRRALLNLAQNAVQASKTGGRVVLAAPHDGTLRVTDEGAGIPADIVAKIWTPFYTTKQKGTGLGLAFVKEIIEDHGGRIDVTSVPGGGTMFVVSL